VSRSATEIGTPREATTQFRKNVSLMPFPMGIAFRMSIEGMVVKDRGTLEKHRGNGRLRLAGSGCPDLSQGLRLRRRHLARNVSTEGEVDAALDAARRAGAKILKPAQEVFWGCYSELGLLRRSRWLPPGRSPTTPIGSSTPRVALRRAAQVIMRALLSSVGTRGDVQPIVALALRMRDLGHEVRLCVPPNFVQWVRGFRFEAVPVGVEMRYPVRNGDGSAAPLTAAQLRKIRDSMPDLITDQFDAIGAAAEGCDVILGANAHQYAARSIAELRRVPYVTALYAPLAIPSPAHSPPPAPGETWTPGDAATNARLWADHLGAWNERALERVNRNRSRFGLSPIDDVLRYNITAHPWLATDAALAPVPTAPGFEVFQTGAWILEDSTSLAPEVEEFLAKGEPPVYLGFGSMPAPKGASRTLLDAVRALGRRAILSRGWAELGLVEDATDRIAVEDVSHQALFPHLAGVVHHGGAGTTASAARAAVPQVAVPLFGDQFYWASRVRALGIGSSVVGTLTAETSAKALREALDPKIAQHALSVGQQLRSDGAMVAARRLASLPLTQNDADQPPSGAQ
jgi:vancomycin aglycone glucosyltransferase